MKFSEYVQEQVKKRKLTKTKILQGISEKSGVSLLTLHNVSKGGRMTIYDKAKSISEATGGKVTVQELCE